MVNEHRPKTILFALTSLNGKLSTGTQDMYDVEVDYPKIKGLCEGLHQYYQIETSFFTEGGINWYLCTGRTLSKVGWDEIEPVNLQLEKRDVNMVVVDDNHLSVIAGLNLCKAFKKAFIVTSNKHHPLLDAVRLTQSKPKLVQAGNIPVEIWSGDDGLSDIFILYVENKSDKLISLFKVLYTDFGCNQIVIQSGGTLNSELLRLGLIDTVDIVVAPCLIAGKGITNLVDGTIWGGVKDISNVKVLAFESIELLNNSYIRLRYHVIKGGV